MKVFIVYSKTDQPAESSEAITEEYGPERVAADVIDGDTHDCLVIWRSIVGEEGEEREVVRVASTGVYEHIGVGDAQAFINLLENSL